MSFLKIKSSTSLFCLAIITLLLFFIIPSFSVAIFFKVFPRNSSWSKPIAVIMLKNLFGIIFVASSLPPNPVSRIKKSALYCAKRTNAAAVVISKKVIGLFWFIFLTNFKLFNNLLAFTCLLLIFILSLNFSKCGDV